jgi:hypothetical protein
MPMNPAARNPPTGPRPEALAWVAAPSGPTRSHATATPTTAAAPVATGDSGAGPATRGWSGPAAAARHPRPGGRHAGCARAPAGPL